MFCSSRKRAGGKAQSSTTKKPRAIKQVVSTSSLLGDTESDEDAPMVSAVRNSKGLLVTATGRPSVKRNEINGSYTPKYHNPNITRTILGKTMTLGGAMALLATIRHGHQLPTDEHGHAARVRIWCNAYMFALTEEERIDVMDCSDAAFALYLKGLTLSSTYKIRCEMLVNARAHFQSEVFTVARKTKEIQNHLGLEMHQTILDQ